MCTDEQVKKTMMKKRTKDWYPIDQRTQPKHMFVYIQQIKSKQPTNKIVNPPFLRVNEFAAHHLAALCLGSVSATAGVWKPMKCCLGDERLAAGLGIASLLVVVVVVAAAPPVAVGVGHPM